jgi:hypothetical protein
MHFFGQECVGQPVAMPFIKKTGSLMTGKKYSTKNSFKGSFFVATLEDELQDVLDHVGVVDDAGLLQ